MVRCFDILSRLTFATQSESPTLHRKARREALCPFEAHLAHLVSFQAPTEPT
jgi:hypothetical protein